MRWRQARVRSRNLGDVAADDLVRHIPPRARVEADPTAGITRERAIEVAGMWAGVARTPPGNTTAWHHHGDHETAIYIVSGRLRMESGPGGNDVIEGAPGDFLHVPPGAIHRESNPSDGESAIVVVRAGSGPPTVNVDGPA